MTSPPKRSPAISGRPIDDVDVPSSAYLRQAGRADADDRADVDRPHPGSEGVSDTCVSDGERVLGIGSGVLIGGDALAQRELRGDSAVEIVVVLGTHSVHARCG
jgi:hypothetical protein